MSDTPIWKKEIHLRKRRDESPTKTPPPAGEKKASIWKRELRLRKPESQKSETPPSMTPATEPAAFIEPVETTPVETNPFAEPEPAEPLLAPILEDEREETAWEPATWSSGSETDEQTEPAPAAEPAAWAYPGAEDADELPYEHPGLEPAQAEDVVETELELESPTAFGGSADWWKASEPENDPESGRSNEPAEHAEPMADESMVLGAFADSDPASDPVGGQWAEPEPVPAAWFTDDSAAEEPAEQDRDEDLEPGQGHVEPVWSATSRIEEPSAELEPLSAQAEEPLSSEELAHEPASDHPGYTYIDDEYPAGEPIAFEPVARDDVAPAAFDPLPASLEPAFEQAEQQSPVPGWSISGSERNEAEELDPTLPSTHELETSEPSADEPTARENGAEVAAAAGIAMAATPDLLPSPEETTLEVPKQGRLKRDAGFRSPRRRKQKDEAGSILATAAEGHAVKNLVGLRIGSSQLAAARIHNNGAAELMQVARTPLSRGIVSGGEVRDVESLTRALKAFFAEHKLPRRGVRLGIASNRIGVRLLEVPKVDDPKLFENSIRFHAQETLPIAVTDAILDHVVLGPGEGQGLDATVRVLLVFAHRELVDRHVEACRRAGLKLDGIDLEAFALLRALAEPLPAEAEATRAIVAVAVGQERTIFAVSDGRICDFTRVLEWGGGSLDVAIARALDLTPSQAEPIKLALSLADDVAPSQLEPEKVEEARAAIRNELQALSRELVSSLQFYQARPGSLDIGEILLSGGGAQLGGFAAELEQLIGVPVSPADPFARVTLNRKVARPADAGSLAVAIGLAIED